LGAGASGILWKTANTHHGIAVETGSVEKFNVHRHEILAWTADQGDDIEVPTSPLLLRSQLDDIHFALERIWKGESTMTARSSTSG
jgi:hypothetical protein